MSAARRDPELAGLWRYPFSLAEGVTAWLFLPPQLTSSDVDRLTEMLRSLVIEETAP